MAFSDLLAIGHSLGRIADALEFLARSQGSRQGFRSFSNNNAEPPQDSVFYHDDLADVQEEEARIAYTRRSGQILREGEAIPQVPDA